MTEPEPLQRVDRTHVSHHGRKLLYFSGCDYFRLASHPAVLKAARDSVRKFGLNVAASRLTTGNHELYQELEKQLAEFFEAEDALLLSAGYLATLAVAQALAGSYSHALVDEEAHPSLLDAAQMFDCPILRFKHCDANELEQSIVRCGRGARPVVLTDGLFSHDGSVAPLKSYLKRLPADGLLLIDDAHGAGLLGETGKGSIEFEEVKRQRIVQCATLSKAFGVYGGVVLGSRELREKILTRSRLFAGSTPLPLPMAGAALKAVEILSTDKRLRQRLARNTLYVKTALQSAGLNLPQTPGPIVSIVLNDELETALLKRRLLEAGIYPPFIKYPGRPAQGFFRFVLSSEHSPRQLDRLIAVLKQGS
jgi:7-keto-8-aminopelargonate synthetase-like enzyme